MPTWSHLASCPDNFEDLADVVFVVGGQRMPAYSQSGCSVQDDAEFDAWLPHV